MTTAPQRLAWWLVVLFVALVTIAGICAQLSLKGLGQLFDYTYFLNSYERAFSVDRLPSFSSVPCLMPGHGLLVKGCDGDAGIDYDLHFEPIKYLVAIPYYFLRSPIFLFLLFALVFYIPLLYIAYLIRREPQQAGVLAFVGLSYALFPASLPLAIDNLRPFTFIFPLFLLLLLSCAYHRPWYERLTFLVLLCCAREEGIVLALLPLALLWWRERRAMLPRSSWKLALVWCAFPLAVAGYYAIVGSAFERYIPLSHPASQLVAWLAQSPLTLAGLAAFGVAAVLCVRYMVNRFGLAVLFLALAIAEPIVLLVLGLQEGYWNDFFLVSRTGLLFWLLLLAAFLAYVAEHPGMQWHPLRPVALVLIVAFIVGNSIGPNSAFSKLRVIFAAIPDATLVWRASSDLGTHIPMIVTTTTLVAFAQSSRVWVMTPTQTSAQDTVLMGQLHDGTYTAMVITHEAIPQAQTLARKANVSLAITAENEHYIWYQIRR